LKQFRFRPETDEDKISIENLAKEAGLSESDYLTKYFHERKFAKDSMSGLERKKEDYLDQKIVNLKLTNEKLRRELLFEQTFDKTPSSQAKKAIKEGVELSGFNPPEYERDSFVSKNISNFIESLRMEGGVTINCKLCPTGFPSQGSKEHAMETLRRHLLLAHEKEILELMLNV